MKVLVLSGPNHRFADSASVIHDFLGARGDMSVELTETKGSWHRLNWTNLMSVCSAPGSLVQSVSLMVPPSGNRTSRLSRRTVSFNLSAVERDWSAFTERHGGLADVLLDLIGGACQLAPTGRDFHREYRRLKSPDYTGRWGLSRSRTRSICPLMIPTSISLHRRNGQRNSTRWRG